MRDSLLQKLMERRVLAALAVPACLLTSACDEVEVAEPIALQVTPLSANYSCGDADSAPTYDNPFASSWSAKLTVRAPNEVTGLMEEVASTSKTVSGSASLEVPKVPEGTGRDIILFAEAGGHKWYGRDSNLTIRRNEVTQAGMALAPHGALSCIRSEELDQAVFPAAVSLGDGRILVTGGFTEITGGAGAQQLAGPSRQAYLFDPRTGKSETLADMPSARAAHAGVYLKSINKVLLVGGATQLGINEDAERFPIDADTTGAAGLNDYVLFDVETKTFSAGSEQLLGPRIFPRLLELNDGTILISGGAAWPGAASYEALQAEVEVFDPDANDAEGGLLDIPEMRSNYPRVGHSITTLEVSPEGLSSALIWGGTMNRSSLGNPAELFRQSGRQREGVNGTFSPVSITTGQSELPAFLYFHETTRLTNRRFLVTGGARPSDAAPGSAHLLAPQDNEAWLLQYDEPGRPVINARRLTDMGGGRVFHTALSSDEQFVSVVGGFKGLNVAADPFVTFNVNTFSWSKETLPASQSNGRGGQAAVLTPAGALFLVGGASGLTSSAMGSSLVSEIYTPSSLPLP